MGGLLGVCLMELMNQPISGQLGDRILELLGSSHYHTLNIAVAFAKNSGVLRIKGGLEQFRTHGGKVNAYVGVDLGGTSYEALGSRLIEFHSQNKTVAASMIAEKKVSGQRSYRVATRRQSFRRPNMISMRLRCL